MRRPYPLLLISLLFSSCTDTPDNNFEHSIGHVHTIWLILLSGFSASILFFIWKNLAGYSRIRLTTLFGIITQKVGDEKNDLGILALSLAILCWFISGIFSLLPNPFITLLATSICSSLNSCFLLLFLRHLDKEDLPAGFRAYFPSRHTIWTVFIILLLATLAIAGSVYAGIVPGFAILLPDLAFSLYTLYFIGFSFFYLLTARMKSLALGILSAVPIIITLLAELCRLVSFQDPENPNWGFILTNQTLLFTYKPLLIISYFVLIYSWQLKRINRNEPGLPLNISQATRTTTISDTNVQSNRAHYRNLGSKDWMILEWLARGEKATSIAAANASEFPNGAKGVDDRISAIAREFQLAGQSQMKIVVAALKRGLLKLEDIP
ncbi:MAG: hypothetical protein H7246_18115 [Phycisphaerae bacterium]|nr:hypothetical protein [Saprospiraceae bacterium]